MNISRRNNSETERPTQWCSFSVCLIVAIIYGILLSTRLKDVYKMRPKGSVRSYPTDESEQGQPPRSPLTPGNTSIMTDQPYLIDLGIIQVVLVITAIAFAIPAFTVNDTIALSFSDSSFFLRRININEVANLVFIASGTISMLLYSVYLWEWTRRNVRTSVMDRSRLWLAVVGLIGHLSFLLLLAAMLILQVLAKNVLPSQNT